MTGKYDKYNSTHSVAEIRSLIYVDLDLELLEAQAARNEAAVLDIQEKILSLFRRMDQLWEGQRDTRARKTGMLGLSQARSRIEKIPETASVFDRSIALDAARCDSKKSIMALEKVGVK